MIKGIFIHRPEVAGIPLTTCAYVAVRAVYGKVADSNLLNNWIKATPDTKRMLYDATDSNAAVSVYDTASFFIEAIQGLQASQGQSWREQPVIVNINQPHIDLLWVGKYVSYMLENILGDQGKILLYTTPKKWNSIQIDTPEGVRMKDAILRNASLMVSQYGVDKPDATQHVPLVQFWEYKPGFFEYKEDGKFDHSVPAEPEEPEEPEEEEEVSSEFYLHLRCPHCGKKIF
ncbi:MAG TPA: hypothetical protein PKJ08_02980 [Candidatus Cloacimonadota bacterium]|nr:hypothetical protein [Candidatus Cloacimonadota bacterium]